MRSSLARRVVAVLLAQSLFLPAAFAQQQTAPIAQQQTETRPRRAQSAWPQPSAVTSPVISSAALTPLIGPEPTIRVALTTEARSAVISTTGHLMNASGSGSTLLALDTSRVRVDAHLLSPLPASNNNATFRVIVAGAAS